VITSAQVDDLLGLRQALLEVLDGLRTLGLEGVATHPSDLAVALIALDALVITRDSNGEHPIRISEFFRQPVSTSNQ
jgi:FAD binding domain in molybdopterin dehydrogenase